MFLVQSFAMPWVLTNGQNSAYSFSVADGGVPTVVLLRGAPTGASIKVGWISGAISGSGPQGGAMLAPPGSPSDYASGINARGELVGAFTDSNGNVISVLNMSAVGGGPTNFTVPAGATQLQMGVNWGGGGRSWQGNTGAWLLSVYGIGPLGAGRVSATEVNGVLIIDDPVEVVTPSPLVTTGGLTDRSNYLHFGEGAHGLGGSESSRADTMLKQRGTATIALRVLAGDNYLPTKGTQIFLYDLTPTDQDPVFSGFIQSVQTSWWGTAGDRLVSLTCVSMEQCLDAIRVWPGRLYQQQRAGFIFSDLFSLATGSPLRLGNISQGPIVDKFFIEGLPTIAAMYTKLCQLEAVQFVWSVDPGSQQISFGAPGGNPAPWTVERPDVIWEGLDIDSTQQDFRDRQAIAVDFAAFGNSNDVFVGAGQQSFALRTPVHQVIAAFITKNTQNTAIGTFTGQPKFGDQVLVNYPSSGSIYNWAANSPYYVGQTIVDPNNHLQRVTTAATPGGYKVPNAAPSGMTQPTWNDTGGLTNDGTYLQWQDMGAIGIAGPYQAAIYTFVHVVDNTQWGQVLIDSTLALTCQNLVDAINATFPYLATLTSSPLLQSMRGAGYGFSLPTWENPLISADQPNGASSFTIRNQNPGQGYIASIGSVSSAFSWSAAQTAGGITTFRTYSISTGAQAVGSDGTGGPVSYQPGSNLCYLPSPLNAGTNLSIAYQRIDGNMVQVEDTPLVLQRAVIEASTGKYQALTSDSAAAPRQALSEAQAALNAFRILPETLEFQTYRPGMKINQLLTFGWDMPFGPSLEVPESSSDSNLTAKITIDHTKCGSQDSGGFTFLFEGTYPELRTVANGGYATNSSGYDITFTSDEAGADMLTWEVESYNPVTGAIIAWVLLPNLSSSVDTVLWLQVGNSGITTFQGGATGAAWEEYNVVLHLPNGSVLTALDSSGLGNNATISATGATATSGQIDGAAALDGSSGYLAAPNQVSKTLGSIEIWAYQNPLGGNSTYFLMGVSGGVASPWPPAMYAAGIGLHFYYWVFGASNLAVSSSPVTSSGFNLIQISWSQSGNFANVYINGVAGGSIAYDPTVTIPSPYPIGGAASWAGYWPGTVDEFRMSGIPRSQSWNLSRYNNESSPSTFYSVTFGPQWIIQEVQIEIIPTPDNLGSSDPNGAYGLMRYTVRAVNLAQIGSYLDFWSGLGGGGGGGSATSSPAYAGGTMPAAPAIGSPAVYTGSFSATADVPLAIVHGLNLSSASAVLVQVYTTASPMVMVQPQLIQVVDGDTLLLTFGGSFSGVVNVLGIGVAI